MSHKPNNSESQPSLFQSYIDSPEKQRSKFSAVQDLQPA